jgi:hypothetical protein
VTLLWAREGRDGEREREGEAGGLQNTPGEPPERNHEELQKYYAGVMRELCGIHVPSYGVNDLTQMSLQCVQNTMQALNSDPPMGSNSLPRRRSNAYKI